jgi:hypothetical protein
VLVSITRSSYKETYEFAERVSRGLEAENPGLVTTEWLKKKRLRPGRPPPERARHDDRVCVLGSPEAGGTGVNAPALGGALDTIIGMRFGMASSARTDVVVRAFPSAPVGR